MFERAEDLAKAALALLGQAENCIEIGQYETAGQIEIAAAALAVHVVDWHVLPRKVTKEDKEAFRSFSPEWGVLRDVANGVKHPQVATGTLIERQPAWEDPDFWDKSAMPGELIVRVEQSWQSIQGNIKTFCERYLSRSGPIGVAG